ncbi:hypothetical protein FPOAC2_13621 [Fusarium poae]
MVHPIDDQIDRSGLVIDRYRSTGSSDRSVEIEIESINRIDQIDWSIDFEAWPQHTRGEYTGAFSQAESLDDDHRRRIQISINNCWSKLDEYYSLLGQSSLYPAAVILHPRWNVSWLEANWTSHEQLVWLRDAKNSVREFFEQQYPRKEQYEAARAMTGKAMRQDEPSQFDQWMQSYDQYMMEEEDEIGVYMRQGPVWRENLNPILWWKEH